METEIKKPEEKSQDMPINWLDVLEQAERVNLELKEKLEESKKVLNEQRELTARNLLGGQINAGIQPPTAKPETPAEYKARIMSGKI